MNLEGLIPASNTSCSPTAAASAQKTPQMLSIPQLSYVKQGGCCMRTGGDDLFLFRTPLGAPERLFLRFSVACFHHPCCCHSVLKSCLTAACSHGFKSSHGLQHARLSCHSLSLQVCSNSRTLSWLLSNHLIFCHPTPLSSCPQSFQALGSFPMSQLFASHSQSIGASASASVLAMSIPG